LVDATNHVISKPLCKKEIPKRLNYGEAMANLDEISKAVIKGEGVKVLTLTKATLDAGVPAKEILDNALVPGIQKVGDLFEKGG
jgi:methanogenic corrinoid protein MtbC1